ncbi:hypothetical protein [Vibrio sp. V15_P4S5T153]|uniref:hypothetical protein n=1 Tax=Vibrio sp. V15_P4S5T153 TaxID=1938669 RepID=UPI000B8F7BCB|nr:hypothetical protein [Vibrio sp. V15_P4S5T153]OXX65096.1 hypothetical protein B9J89_04215 [Vibrio sp. V15_P4S5T153]
MYICNHCYKQRKNEYVLIIKFTNFELNIYIKLVGSKAALSFYDPDYKIKNMSFDNEFEFNADSILSSNYDLVCLDREICEFTGMSSVGRVSSCIKENLANIIKQESR